MMQDALIILVKVKLCNVSPITVEEDLYMLSPPDMASIQPLMPD